MKTLIALALLLCASAASAYPSVTASWAWDGLDNGGNTITDPMTYAAFVCDTSYGSNCQTPPSSVAPPYPATDGWEANYPDPSNPYWNEVFWGNVSSPDTFQISPFADNITVNPGDLVCVILYAVRYWSPPGGEQYVFSNPSNIACKQF